MKLIEASTIERAIAATNLNSDEKLLVMTGFLGIAKPHLKTTEKSIITALKDANAFKAMEGYTHLLIKAADARPNTSKIQFSKIADQGSVRKWVTMYSVTNPKDSKVSSFAVPRAAELFAIDLAVAQKCSIVIRISKEAVPKFPGEGDVTDIFKMISYKKSRFEGEALFALVPRTDLRPAPVKTIAPNATANVLNKMFINKTVTLDSNDTTEAKDFSSDVDAACVATLGQKYDELKSDTPTVKPVCGEKCQDDCECDADVSQDTCACDGGRHDNANCEGLEVAVGLGNVDEDKESDGGARVVVTSTGGDLDLEITPEGNQPIVPAYSSKPKVELEGLPSEAPMCMAEPNITLEDLPLEETTTIDSETTKSSCDAKISTLEGTKGETLPDCD